MFQWFSDWWISFKDYLASLWADFIEFMVDLPRVVLSGIFDALASIIESIPLPEFVQTGGLQMAVLALPDSIQYFMFMSGVVEALAILGLGFAFRLTRKLVTLFQW